MALDTPTISRLLDTRQASLEKLGIRTREQLGTLMNGARTRAERLFREIDTLRAYEDPAPQQEAYGPAWNDEFMFASRANGGIELGMKQLRNSRYARVQRALGEPQYWHVPRMGRGDLDTMSLRSTLLSAGLYGDDLLVDVGFATEDEFEHFRGDPIGRVGFKTKFHDPMKLMMENATPLDPRQQRLLRLDAPTDASKRRYPEGTPTISDDAVGGILYTRERTSREKGPRRLLIQHFPSAYAALRKTYHEDTVYAQEIDTLASCQNDVHRMLWRLNDGYRKGTPDDTKQRLWREAEAVIIFYNEKLKASMHRLKIEARDFLLGASDLKDAKGKENISKVMAKMTATLQRVALRIDDMKPKGGFNAQDRMTLHAQIQREEGELLHVRRGLTQMALDFEGDLSSENDIAARLELSVRDLEKVRLKPLAKPAHAMIRQIQALTPADPHGFRDQLLTLHVIGKIQALITSLERVRGRIAQNGRIDFEREAAFTANVLTAFSGEQLFPGRTVPRLEEFMEPFREQLAELHMELEDHAQNPPSEGATHEEARRELEEAMDAFDTENALDAIVLALPEAIPYQSPFVLTSKK